jgi:hypothetical protein
MKSLTRHPLPLDFLERRFGVRLGALPPLRKNLPKKKRGDAKRFESAPLCTAIMKDGCACGSRALNESTRQRKSRELGYEVPAGLCRTHVKWHAERFHQIAPAYEFQRAKLCGKPTYQSGRTLPCRNPCMHGASSCNVHGSKGAGHGWKGVGPWNAEGGRLAWERRRVDGGAYRGAQKFDNVRVKKEDRPAHRDTLLERYRAQRLIGREPEPVSQTLSDEFHAPVRKKLRPLYEA